MTPLHPLLRPLLLAAALILAPLAAAAATDRDRLAAFLQVTGYDVVITSLQQAAMAGPGMVGDAPQTFGQQYREAAEEVFEPELMVNRALDILAAVMTEPLVQAGADFYASDLGQRLVAAENAAHMQGSDVKFEQGQEILAEATRANPQRVEVLKAMNAAIGSEEVGRRAIVEIQLRFILAAQAAGALPQGPTEEDLRGALTAQAQANAAQSALYALISNAYTYRDVSDADLDAYLQALRTPEMQQVYEILNATQYQVMMERYQALGQRLGGMAPQQDL